MITEQRVLCVNFLISQESLGYEIQQHLQRASYVNSVTEHSPRSTAHILNQCCTV
jgi:hypothetical protein